QWAAVVRRVRIFADRARAPHDEGPSLLGAEHAGDGTRRGTPQTEDERALVEAYCEIRQRRGFGDVVPLDLHFGAARRVLPDLRKLEERAKPKARGCPAPTWLEIARHRLEAFFRDADAKLEAAGFPLDWLLHRTDAAGLPLPRAVRGRGPEHGSTIKPPDRRLAPLSKGRADGGATEIKAAMAEFNAVRARAGGAS